MASRAASRRLGSNNSECPMAARLSCVSSTCRVQGVGVVLGLADVEYVELRLPLGFRKFSREKGRSGPGEEITGPQKYVE